MYYEAHLKVVKVACCNDKMTVFEYSDQYLVSKIWKLLSQKWACGDETNFFMIHKFLRWSPLFGAVFFFACSDSVRQFKKPAATPQPENIILTLLREEGNIEGEELFAPCAINEIYSSRHYYPFWFKRNELTAQGDTLMRVLHRAHYFGLVPADYHLKAIDRLSWMTKMSMDAKTLARIDLLMTDGLLAMAHHLHNGRIDRDRLVIKSPGEELDSLLWDVIHQSISKNNITEGLESLEPQYSFYKLLKKDLRGKLDSLSFVVTDSMMSRRIKQQVRDLSVNMEQWRWETAESKEPYILVNIPSFYLGVVDNDSMVFESNVVVGAPYSQTPVLDAKLVNLILYPYWNVPRDIATKELLPKVKHDPTYLVSNRYKVLDIRGKEIHPDSVNWKEHHVNNFPFMFQQSEGEHNALGIVKFNFVNDFNIYLHDTNAKRFFAFDKRAYSHGCVRVERALDLAKFLVGRENPYSSENDLQRVLKAGKQQQLNVDPIDLRIRYFTCQPGSDGKVQFFDDVYGKNAPLMDAFFCRAN